jgi:hypothetical protein
MLLCAIIVLSGPRNSGIVSVDEGFFGFWLALVDLSGHILTHGMLERCLICYYSSRHLAKE